MKKPIPSSFLSFIFLLLLLSCGEQTQQKKNVTPLTSSPWDLAKKISSHIASHSFADIARKKGIKLYDISKALGHSILSITDQYLANFDDNSLDDAMDQMFE